MSIMSPAQRLATLSEIINRMPIMTVGVGPTLLKSRNSEANLEKPIRSVGVERHKDTKISKEFANPLTKFAVYTQAFRVSALNDD